MRRFKIEYLFALPALIVFFIFFIYPFLNGFWLSLTKWNGYTDPTFIGLKNFEDIFQDARALSAIKNTVVFALISTPLLNLFGLGYALLLENTRSMMVKVTRTLVYVPAIISPLIMGYVWFFIMKSGGTGQELLSSLGLNALIFDWLAKPSLALALIITVNTWQFAGMTMIIYLSALQAVPQELYEAADVDGASYWQKLIHVKLPSITSAITINILTNIIGSLAIFDVIVALTDGGPGYATESLSIYIMRMSYGGSTGFAVAVAMVMFFITFIPVMTYIALTKKKGLAI
ncbi:MAG: sugar ABC transporter permease [Bifidobacterium psychraerophilum]|uniref:carbohydrate ABC transporter permease n=1 Tax=Bifidobacterium psychraerophilum TaxID=218140 RepID=UPI0039EB172D